MDIQDIGSIGELIAAIATILTLIYLAAQIRQSNAIARFDTAKGLMDQFNHLNHAVATDDGLRRALMAEEPDEQEREAIYNLAIMFCNVWLSCQTAHDNALIDDELFQSALDDVSVELDRWPHFREAVERWLRNYPANQRYRVFAEALSGMEDAT